MLSESLIDVPGYPDVSHHVIAWVYKCVDKISIEVFTTQFLTSELRVVNNYIKVNRGSFSLPRFHRRLGVLLLVHLILNGDSKLF